MRKQTWRALQTCVCSTRKDLLSDGRFYGVNNSINHGTCDCFRFSQMPYTDQITENAPCVRTYSLVTI